MNESPFGQNPIYDRNRSYRGRQEAMINDALIECRRAYRKVLRNDPEYRRRV
ncbi:MAG: hypothetical protein IPN42_19585 [Methylococcaceae bacterium]|nr:hypothetical protein [Methylococcaceae bacterium]